MNIKLRKIRRSLTAALSFLIAPLLSSGAALWTGATDLNWSQVNNWDPAGSPAGNDVLFYTNGVTASGDTSVVNASYSLNSLVFGYTNGPGHRVRIADGQTLTLTNVAPTVSYGGFSVSAAMRVGGEGLEGATVSTTTSLVTGVGGALVVNSPAKDIFIGTVKNGAVGSLPGLAKLDLSGLGFFTASVATIHIGSVPGGVTGYKINGEWDLAETNIITASALQVAGEGYDTGTGSRGVMLLGQSNLLQMNTLNVSGVKSSIGILAFNPVMVEPSLTLRAKNGTGRAALSVGWHSAYRSPLGTVDLRGGTVDALLGTLHIGMGQSSAATTSTFAFDSGTVDATSVSIGTGGFGHLILAGGSLTVPNITMGAYANFGASGAGPGGATMTLSNGTLAVASIVPGSGIALIRKINWHSGTIQNYASSNLVIVATNAAITNLSISLLSSSDHTFAIETGRTGTVTAAISGTNGTGGLVKTGAGVLILATPDTNTYQGATVVSNGILLVNCISTNQGDYSVSATLGGTGEVGLASGKLLTINTGGTLAPGVGSAIGALSVKGDVAIAGTYEAQIDCSNLVATNDMLNVAGSLTLAPGSRLAVTMSGTNRPSRCVLARYTGTLTGRFETYDLPANFSIFYGTGNNSSLAVGIPEGTLFVIQ